jgi:uncharacterized protein YcbX
MGAGSATVVKLWRYPVKSMLGETLAHLDVDARGVVGDRMFAVRDANGKFGSGKSTRRFARIDGLFSFSAAYDAGVPRITFPSGRVMLGTDPEVHGALSAALGQPVTLAREGSVSHLDAGPLHVLTTASLAWLSQTLPDARIDGRRFRPNVLVDVPGTAQIEQEWIGHTVRIGDQVTLRIRQPTERCVMVTFAQTDLPEDPRVLRTLAEKSDADFGVYADVVTPGRIALGDAVTVET